MRPKGTESNLGAEKYCNRVKSWSIESELMQLFLA